MVEHSPAMIEALEDKGFDVGFVGEQTEAGVYLDDVGEAQLRAEGYRIGAVVSTAEDFAARKAEIAATKAAEAVAAKTAQTGRPAGGEAGKSAVNVPGPVVIQRSYTFSNYAGRFLYVEAKNRRHTDTTGPAMSMSYTYPGMNPNDGQTRTFSLSNASITPDGGDAAIGGNKIRDFDADDGSQYMYHRGLIALRGNDANLQAGQITVTVADAGTPPASDSATPTEWTAKALPPRVAAFQKDFITKYMDPTEIYGRMDQLTQQFPDIMEAINLPHKTAGYRRNSSVVLEGNTVNPSATTGEFGNPNNNTQATSIASRARAVQLFSKALGHEGGDNITAAFKVPVDTQGAAVPNSPLTVTVSPGTWEDVDPADTNAADGFGRIQVPVQDIVVNLATNDAGAATSTAKQVIDAINADPAASALVTAYTYANNVGDGVVAPTPTRDYAFPKGTQNTGQTYRTGRVRLSDGIRGGTVYWTGSATNVGTPPVRPPTLTRTDARHVPMGPFQGKVYRIGKSRDNSAVGVYLYCQQHAREWVTPITCLETAERLVRNYATDPTTKEYVDKLNVFILPVVNPDGGHAAFHDNTIQRKNLHELLLDHHDAGRRRVEPFTWGVDLNRNNTVGTLFDGPTTASSSVRTRTARAKRSSARARRPSPRSRTSTGSRTRSRASSSRTTSTRTAATSCGRRARTGARAARRCRRRTSASRSTSSRWRTRSCRTSAPRGTRRSCRSASARSPTCCTRRPATRPTSTYYKRGHHRLLVRGRRAAHCGQSGRRARSRASTVGFQPCFGGPGTHGGARAATNRNSNRCVRLARTRTRCWSTRVTTPRWSSPTATTA